MTDCPASGDVCPYINALAESLYALERRARQLADQIADLQSALEMTGKIELPGYLATVVAQWRKATTESAQE